MILFLKVGNMLVDGILLANSCVASTEPRISCSTLSPSNRLGSALRCPTRIRNEGIAWCGGSSRRGGNDLNPGHRSLVSIFTASRCGPPDESAEFGGFTRSSTRGPRDARLPRFARFAQA